MKILVVGYACNPYVGSEPGVGWAAVCRIAKRHEVCVLTDVHNRAGWERGEREGIIPSNVRVRFLRESDGCSSNRFIAHLQSWLNYASFNREVLEAAQAWHREESFDLCHQVTIAAWRMPSPLWQLPIPFVWGPIGGAGYIPPAFRRMLTAKARIFEWLRDLNTLVVIRSRAFVDCVKSADVIICANEETELFIRKFRGNGLLERLPVMSMTQHEINRFFRPRAQLVVSRPLRLFAGGNIEGRKGVSLALDALAVVAARGVDFRYTVAGGGPEVVSLKKRARLLGIGDKVEFHGGFRGREYLEQLWDTDVYFLPSFRETMGMTLVEAIISGAYPVVADASAQGEIVRMVGGSVIPISNVHDLIQGLAEAVIWCDLNRGLLLAINQESRKKVGEYVSSARFEEKLDALYERAVDKFSDRGSC